MKKDNENGVQLREAALCRGVALALTILVIRSLGRLVGLSVEVAWRSCRCLGIIYRAISYQIVLRQSLRW